MSIKIEKSENKPDETIIRIDNGHAASLKKIMKDYNLKGESEAISFMLGVLDTANGKKIEIGGNSYLPSDDLKKADN